MDKPTPNLIKAKPIEPKVTPAPEVKKKPPVRHEHLMHGAFRNNEQMRELQRELNKNKPKRAPRHSK